MLNLEKMKKIFMAISLVVVLTLFFSSCKKEEVLDNTTWKCETFEYQHPDFYYANYKFMLAFIGEQAMVKITQTTRFYADWDEYSDSYMVKGPYTYDQTNVKMHLINNDRNINFDDIWIGKIDKETMTLNVTIFDFDKQVVFTKQE